jgi:glyoxylase-like metal-dependent hydrolase (beta-lactamase superfamily II)
MATTGSALQWDVFVTPSIPIRSNDPAPGIDKPVWSPIASTLIFGERDAVIVDPVLTINEARTLADWIASSGKNLTTIYATHGHGDHFFGAATILERFTGARFVAAPNVVEKMRQQASHESMESFWNPLFPGQISDHLVVADELARNAFDLEGCELVVVPTGHTDTDNTTCLHVPSIGLVVAGDVAYNDVHLYLAESDQQKRREWIAALDKIELLKPRAIIAGHKRPGTDDQPRIIEETRQYIRDFDQIAGTTMTARELYDQMLALYPQRVNPGALWLSAQALKTANS